MAKFRRVQVVGLGALSVLTGACGNGERPSEDAARARGPIVWGAQSWKEYSEGTPGEQELATSVGLLVASTDLTGNSTSTFTPACQDPAATSFNCTAVLTTYPNDLCSDDPYVGDFAPQRITDAACTAFMIRPDTFATAAHCIMPDGVGDARLQCSNRSVVMRWRPSLPNFPEGNPNILSQHIYRCVSLTRGPEDPQVVGDPGDWAVFTVDRPVTGGGTTGGPLTPEREPLPVSNEPLLVPSSGNLAIGHPNGMPLKIDPEVTIALEPAPNRPGGTFAVEADVEEGLSGGPVITPDGSVVGILSGALGLLRDNNRNCFNECFPDSDPTPPTCPSLFGQFRPIAVNISQIPSQYRTTAEHVMILLDQTGTMTLPGTAAGLTRWDDAINAAIQWVQLDKLSSAFVERAYSIWTFRNDTVIGGTQNGAVQIWPGAGSTDCPQIESGTGYCVLPRAASLEPPEYNALQARLEAIRTSHMPVTGPNTPLAGSLCEGLESIRSIDGLKRIILESDGDENATSVSNSCFGDPSADFADWSTDLSLRTLDDWGMTVNSWQAKVLRRVTRLGLPIATAVASPLTIDDWFPFNVVWQVNLHYALSETTTLAPLTATRQPALPEITDTPTQQVASRALGALLAAASLPPSELSFFDDLGRGNLRSNFAAYVQSEDELGVDHPVAGNVNNDGCADRVDLCLAMQSNVWTHRAVPPNDIAVQADLNRDGWVNDADLDTLFENWGNGCASPEPVPERDTAIAACRADYGRRWTSFEDSSRPWTVNVGSVELTTTTEAATHMQHSLVIDGCNYAFLDSPLFDTRELPAGTRVAFDVMLPVEQANPYWLGDAQLFISIPSAGIYNAWLGYQSFAGFTTGAWHTVTFSLPSGVRAALAGSHADARLGIAFNTGNCLAPALIDYLRVVP